MTWIDEKGGFHYTCPCCEDTGMVRSGDPENSDPCPECSHDWPAVA